MGGQGRVGRGPVFLRRRRPRWPTGRSMLPRNGFTYEGRAGHQPGPGRVTIRHTGMTTVDPQPLPPRHDLWNHSPDGFNWGYGGSGPAQLALAILAHHLGDDKQAVRLHQAFKRRAIAPLPLAESWSMTHTEVAQHVAAIRAEEN